MEQGETAQNRSMGLKPGTSGNSRKYNCRSKSGLYSLKKHESDYVRSKGPDGYHYKCVNCDEYTTKSQASMVRHIWTHKKQNFRCDCGDTFENEFSLYKHKKTTHPELTTHHTRTSSKNKEANKAKEAAAAASASCATVASRANNQSNQHHHSMNAADFSAESFAQAEQLQQQQAFLNWLLAFQTMQQQQQMQESRIQESGPELFNLSAANIAHVYQGMQNGANPLANAARSSQSDPEDEQETQAVKQGSSKKAAKGETKSNESQEVELSKQGLSRRALRFKSHKRKPVQIKQQESDDAEVEEVKNKMAKNGKLKPKDSDDDSENELEIDA